MFLEKYNIKYYLGLVFFIGLTLKINSQVEKNVVLSVKTGNATIESTGQFKTKTDIFGGDISYRLYNSENSSFLLGLELLRSSNNYNFNNSENFLTNTYLSIPIKYQFFSKIFKDNRFRLFFSAGLYNSYLLNSKNENYTTNIKSKANSLNFSMLLEAGLGLRIRVSELSCFNLSIDSRTHLLDIYQKDNFEEFKISDMYLINFGFEFKI